MQNKPIYRRRNWSEYHAALIQKGSLSIWMEEEAIKNWFSSFHTCSAGRPEIYSNKAILMMLILREVYNLTLRNL